MTDKKSKNLQDFLTGSPYLRRLRTDRVLRQTERDVLREEKSTTRYLGTELLDIDLDEDEDEGDLSFESIFPSKAKS
jgi:hypothetical protein